MPEGHSERVPQAMLPVYDAVIQLTDAFCKEHLNDEYADLCRRLTAALARKRPSPLARGRLEVWACGIVYALGSVNFLFDRTQTPHMRGEDLCAEFGVSQSSGASKAKLIRDMFGMIQMDPHWCLPSQLERNPLVWMIQVNGLIVDARRVPREIQEEAYRLKLIPYIPADRK
ncbi:MAG: hypothetical protein A3F84_28660 [Candidatus Handelsmanbacteria bacterium RIFCSPLOWO2_12_FULL_64_10]|uniref:DUF6398 domain-containing protein n=1 Tax=Handelsmanbacteria sp. (strain RIFCSPLOWO2_12_FULL_64_10) TaxID=1817868 RepID=A0A1F6D3U2_HANXR|nr:MAG: hypothetical protein A3F84_28660 [Candidatus Handelsmanbacteria bacterium RIFCSPLOWO2_12_FULL_64_10]